MLRKKWIATIILSLGILILIFGFITNWVLEDMFSEIFVIVFAGIIALTHISDYLSNIPIEQEHSRIIKATRFRIGNSKFLRGTLPKTKLHNLIMQYQKN